VLYLDIESLRLGDRLKVEQTIDPGLLKALMPPFSFQPLVENAVQHGLHSSLRAGRLQLFVRQAGPWLEMSVRDDGQGVPSKEVEQLFFAERTRVHALVLLRRRLQGLFGRSFQLEVRSEIGEGTTVTMRIPLRKRFGVGLESPRAITSELRELAPIGTWKVVKVTTMPVFRWDEAMLKHGRRSSNFYTIPPGPRNPVGIVWIGVNKKGIGIHGTDSPDTIGRSASHGCIRLANWDAARVVNQVTVGMTVEIY
jgi:hypothetical protein